MELVATVIIELYEDEGDREDWQPIDRYVIDVEDSADPTAIQDRFNEQLETLSSFEWANWFTVVYLVPDTRVTEETFLDAVKGSLKDTDYDD